MYTLNSRAEAFVTRQVKMSRTKRYIRLLPDSLTSTYAKKKSMFPLFPYSRYFASDLHVTYVRPHGKGTETESNK